MSTTRFFFHYTALVFFFSFLLYFSFFFSSFFWQNSKITWPQQSGKLCQDVFSTFHTLHPSRPANANVVYSISQKRGQLCPNASATRIRPPSAPSVRPPATLWLAQMMRRKWERERSETFWVCDLINETIRASRSDHLQLIWLQAYILYIYIQHAFPYIAGKTLQKTLGISERVSGQSLLMDDFTESEKQTVKKGEKKEIVIELWQRWVGQYIYIYHSYFLSLDCTKFVAI